MESEYQDSSEQREIPQRPPKRLTLGEEFAKSISSELNSRLSTIRTSGSSATPSRISGVSFEAPSIPRRESSATDKLNSSSDIQEEDEAPPIPPRRDEVERDSPPLPPRRDESVRVSDENLEDFDLPNSDEAPPPVPPRGADVRVSDENLEDFDLPNSDEAPPAIPPRKDDAKDEDHAPPIPARTYHHIEESEERPAPSDDNEDVNEDLRKMVQKLEKELKAKDEVISDLKTENNRLCAEIKSLKDEKRSSDDKIKKLKAENEELKQKNEKLKASKKDDDNAQTPYDDEEEVTSSVEFLPGTSSKPLVLPTKSCVRKRGNRLSSAITERKSSKRVTTSLMEEPDMDMMESSKSSDREPSSAVSSKVIRESIDEENKNDEESRKTPVSARAGEEGEEEEEEINPTLSRIHKIGVGMPSILPEGGLNSVKLRSRKRDDSHSHHFERLDEESLKKWIFATVKKDPVSGNLYEVLHDGQLLCELMNSIRPEKPITAKKGKMRPWCIVNINAYLSACVELNIKTIFKAEDLFEAEEGLDKIIDNLSELKFYADSKK